MSPQTSTRKSSPTMLQHASNAPADRQDGIFRVSWWRAACTGCPCVLCGIPARRLRRDAACPTIFLCFGFQRSAVCDSALTDLPDKDVARERGLLLALLSFPLYSLFCLSVLLRFVICAFPQTTHTLTLIYSNHEPLRLHCITAGTDHLLWVAGSDPSRGCYLRFRVVLR